MCSLAIIVCHFYLLTVSLESKNPSILVLFLDLIMKDR